jgi:hypothetical protein
MHQCDDFNIASDDWEAFKNEKETLEFQVRTQKLLKILYTFQII